MRTHLALALAVAASFATSACEDKPTAAEQAAADDRAVAMVEAAQNRHPPLQPLAPQAFTLGERAQQKVSGSRCAFDTADQAQPIVLVSAQRALMKLEGRPVMFASDPGGAEGPVGTWQHYVGKGQSLRIEREGGDGVRAGQDALQWPARLTVRDEFDRIVYVASGQLRCS